ncbi:MAG: hypothetical protein QOF84_3179 [Streptomyces sp.]|jgi:hypothetical protein|nr:hypothetical protein [Streptomyces sp.]MDX6348389.1 hypothetical protein [Streptomyces sp.]
MGTGHDSDLAVGGGEDLFVRAIRYAIRRKHTERPPRSSRPVGSAPPRRTHDRSAGGAANSTPALTRVVTVVKLPRT